MSQSDPSAQASINGEPPQSAVGTSCNTSAANTNKTLTPSDVQRLLCKIDGSQVSVGTLHDQGCHTEDRFSDAKCTHLDKTMERFKVAGSLCLFDAREYVVVAPVKSWAHTGRSEILAMEDGANLDDGTAPADFDVMGYGITLDDVDNTLSWPEPQRKYGEESQDRQESREVNFGPMRIRVPGLSKQTSDRPPTVQFAYV